MQRHNTKASLLALLTAGSLLLMALGPAHPALADTTADGTIESVQANTISIASGNGDHTQVKTTSETRVINRRPARLEDIRVGTSSVSRGRRERKGP